MASFFPWWLDIKIKNNNCIHVKIVYIFHKEVEKLKAGEGGNSPFRFWLIWSFFATSKQKSSKFSNDISKINIYWSRARKLEDLDEVKRRKTLLLALKVYKCFFPCRNWCFSTNISLVELQHKCLGVITLVETLELHQNTICFPNSNKLSFSHCRTPKWAYSWHLW